MRNTVIHRVISLLVISVGGFGILIPCVGAETPAPDLVVGQAAYEQNCARCHGVSGKGDGRDAKRFLPRPRDLTEGVFKFRSSATGTSPTDDDLFATLTNGLPGSGMPDWRHLDEATRWQLVSYLKTLSENFQVNPPQPVSVGADPGLKGVDAAQGRRVYEKLGCAACHGTSGRANGPSAPSLVDNWGQATRPADLTQGWNYRGGVEPRAIAIRILTGIDGSPMPSYAEAATLEEAWQLAYYVRSLQQEPRWTMIVRVPHVDGLPEAPDDPRWATVERAEVRLRNVVDDTGTLTCPQSVTTVSFQAVHDDETVSLRIWWHDATEDRLPAATGAAQAGKDPVDTLALALHPADIAGDVVTLQTWPLRDSPPLDLCVWSANHLQTREAITRSYEPMLEASTPIVPLKSQAVYEDGQWVVVLTRPLVQPGLEGAAQVAPGQFVPVAFAIWDGGNQGQRAVSTWVDLAIQARPVASVQPTQDLFVVWVLAGVALVVGLALVFRKR